ncbi:hypothetical protein EYF80_029537 [Liparis tanakae]|uniref:Uncharacterized protein n=1 Tax=Liparis tanakae TaxID=230148 RepID=A0A4Z2H5P7_9TELE|nr:hypothetical protein EYF80_029537 [Liparis tanakae]
MTKEADCDVWLLDVREAPDVPQVHGVADHREQEVHLLAPGLSGLVQAGLLDHQSPEASRRRRGPGAFGARRGALPALRGAVGHLLPGAGGRALGDAVGQHRTAVFLPCFLLILLPSPLLPLFLILPVVHRQHARQHHIFRLHWRSAAAAWRSRRFRGGETRGMWLCCLTWRPSGGQRG